MTEHSLACTHEATNCPFYNFGACTRKNTTAEISKLYIDYLTKNFLCSPEQIPDCELLKID
jgi:hypothetical protein